MKKFTLTAAVLVGGILLNPGMTLAQNPAQVPPVPKFKPQSAPPVPVAPPQSQKAQPIQRQQTDGQTMGFALKSAYVNNPTLQAARAQVRATEELLPQALSNWQPDIDASAGITKNKIHEVSPFTGGGDGSTAKSVGASIDQPLYRGGRTMAETAAARYTIEAQKAALMIDEQNILLAAVTTFMNVVRDQALLDLSENNRDVIARQKQATSERFEVGELTKTDVSQADARLARAESERITAEGNLRSSIATYEQIIGVPPVDLIEGKVPVKLPNALDEATSEAESANPSVLASTFIHKASEEDIDNVFGELLPNVSAFGSVDKTRDPSPGFLDDQRIDTIGISASIPLYEGGATRSRVRQAKYIANRRYLEILEARRQAHQEAVTNWEALQTARAEIRSRQAQVQATKIAQEGVRAEAEYGTRSVLDALDADQEALDAQVALVSAQRNEIVAEFALAATLGYLTPEKLGFSESSINASSPPRGFAGWLDTNVDRVGPAQ